MFEGWDLIDLQKIKKYIPVFLEPKYGYSHHTIDPIV